MSTKRNLKDTDTRKNGSRKKAKRDSDSSESTEEGNDGPLVIKCKTVFKKRLVQRALEREEERTSDDDRSDKPSVKYFIKYSVKQDKFSVDNVEIIVDEAEKCLRCSQPLCTYVTKNKWDAKDKQTTKQLSQMEWGMKNHVIGQHLGGFPCKLCEPVPVFYQSFSAHQKHVLEVHNERRKELNAKIKANEDIGGGGGKEDGGGGGGSADSSSEETLYYPDGQRRMKRQYKCSYANCGKKFHKVTRWLRHENQVHGAVKQK